MTSSLCTPCTDLHSSIREVRPTEAEWQHDMDFLTAAGRITGITEATVDTDDELVPSVRLEA